MKLGALGGFLWYSARHGGLRIPAVEEVATFADGEVLDVPGKPRIIHVPGHTRAAWRCTSRASTRCSWATP